MYGAAPMVTTPTATGTKPESIPPFAEHDKLGPLGTKSSVLDSDLELRRALIREFQAAADAARSAAGSADRNTADAVHAYRKALRRARGVLSLVADALPKSERRAVRRALQEARRTLSPARDHVVAPETLRQLPLADLERETANLVLATAAEAAPPLAEIKQLLAEGAARAAAQVEALEAALPAELSWSTVARGVRGIYGDARRARKAAKRSKRSFHTWRRRSKELTYQLELLAGFAGSNVGELHHEIEAATDPQSAAVDLIMLRDFLRTYGQGVVPEAFEALVSAVESQLDDLMADARRGARDAFRAKPRRFVRRLAKAVRRDLAPAPSDDVVAD